MALKPRYAGHKKTDNKKEKKKERKKKGKDHYGFR
jgi:hypothetical protein